MASFNTIIMVYMLEKEQIKRYCANETEISLYFNYIRPINFSDCIVTG